MRSDVDKVRLPFVSVAVLDTARNVGERRAADDGMEDARRMRIEIDAHDRNTRRSRKSRHTLGNRRSGPVRTTTVIRLPVLLAARYSLWEGRLLSCKFRKSDTF